jgi:hypothetical protein
MNKTLKYIFRFIAGVTILVALTGYKAWMHLYLYGDILLNPGPLDSTAESIIISTVLLFIGGMVGLYQIILFGIYVLSLNKTSSPWVNRLLENGIVKIVFSRLFIKLSASQRKWISLIWWSAFVFGFILILSTYQIFESTEPLFLRSDYIKQLYSQRVLGKYDGEAGYQRYLADEPVRYFILQTEDNNLVKYLNDVYKIAKDFKDVGAKVVVAEMPAVMTFPIPDPNKLLSKIKELNIVVWVNQPPHGRFRGMIKSYAPLGNLDQRRSYNVFSVERDPTAYVYEVDKQPINSWHPCMLVVYRMEHLQPVRTLQIDGAIDVAKKYFDIPDTCNMILKNESVTIGNMVIPISSTGAAYSNNVSKLFYRFPITASQGFNEAEKSEKASDSVLYHLVEKTGSYFSTSTRDTVSNITDFKNYYNGKVILINWMNNNGEFDVSANVQAANVISSVLRNDHFYMNDWLTYFLTLISIIGIAVTSMVTRVKWIFLGSILGMGCVSLLSIWLLFASKTLFTPTYPIIAIGISAILFSLLKIIRESKLTVEKMT